MPTHDHEPLEWLLSQRKALLTVKEVAAKLRVVRQVIYNLADEQELEQVRVGNSRRLTRRGVLAYLARGWNEAPVLNDILRIIGTWLHALPVRAIRIVRDECDRLIRIREGREAREAEEPTPSPAPAPVIDQPAPTAPPAPGQLDLFPQ